MLLAVRRDFGDQQRSLRARIVGLFLDGRDDVVRRDGLPPVERGAQQVLTGGEVPVERALRRLEASRKWLYGNAAGAFVQQRLDGGAGLSAAFDIVPRPDWASTTIVAIPHDATSDAAAWARAIFDLRSLPVWVKALGGVRAVVAKVLRLPPGEQAMLAVDRIVDDEAVIDTDDVHLHFAAGVRVDPV